MKAPLNPSLFHMLAELGLPYEIAAGTDKDGRPYYKLSARIGDLQAAAQENLRRWRVAFPEEDES